MIYEAYLAVASLLPYIAPAALVSFNNISADDGSAIWESAYKAASFVFTSLLEIKPLIAFKPPAKRISPSACKTAFLGAEEDDKALVNVSPALAVPMDARVAIAFKLKTSSSR